jgi:hypothetical protein
MIPRSEYDGGRVFGFSGKEDNLRAVSTVSMTGELSLTHVPHLQKPLDGIIVRPFQVEKSQIDFTKNRGKFGELLQP